MSKKLILIDGHALIYRAYHAFTELSTQDGTLVNAVYGFTRILLTVIQNLDPEYIAVAFDSHAPTFRHADYLGYKANRPEMPVDLRPQIDLIKEVVKAFNIPQYAFDGYEADDIIGTMSRIAPKEWAELQKKGEVDKNESLLTIIVTGDKDAFQLVDENVHVWIPGRSKPAKSVDMEYDAAAVEKKMGVRPDQIVDLKALMGDPSDNIPGVSGIGEKTAVKMLQAFGTTEELYRAITGSAPDVGKVLSPKLIEKLAIGHQDAIMSYKLATIDRDVPLQVHLKDCKLSSYNKEDVVKLFEKLEFSSLVKMLPADEFEVEVQQALF